jgi:Zn-dependent protease with chaperone function
MPGSADRRPGQACCEVTVTTTFRAALAVALLAGFYLLVAAFAGLAVTLDVFEASHLNAAAVRGVVLLNIGVLVVLRGTFVVGRRGAQPAGVVVTAREEPELCRTVAALAARVRTRAPDEIRLVAEVNAAVTEESRMLGLWPGKRIMYIGMPLFLGLRVDELRAVLCHELGHYSRAHTRLGAITYQGMTALNGTITRLQAHAFIRRIFVLYARLYFACSSAVARRQELEADAAAVAVAGREAAGDAIRDLHASAAAWNHYLESYCALIEPAQARPADLFAGFYDLIRQPGRREEFARAALVPAQRSAYDSHPSPAERLAAIGRLAEPSVAPDRRRALALLADPASRAMAMQTQMLTDKALRLPIMDWPEIAVRAMMALRAGALADVFTAVAQVADVPEATVDTVLWALASGRTDGIAARLRALRWRGDDARMLVASVLSRAFEGLLVQAGQARWVFSWADGVTLRGIDGAEVRVSEPVLRAVHHPGQVASLYEWLTGHGIPPTARPRRQAAGRAVAGHAAAGRQR